MIPLEATAQSLEAISGPTHGKPGDTLTFVVEARDPDGNPQSGVGVLFSYRPPDDYTPPNDDTSAADDIDISELGTYSATTGAGGRAQTTLILGSDAAGSYQVLAWRTDDATLTTDFTVTVDAAPPPRSTTTTTTVPLPKPTTLERISGDDQEGLPGAVLADPFVIEVRDENGEPLEGVTVRFAVIIGGGAVSVAASRTDTDGQVESTLTLGTDPGTNKVQVDVEDISLRVVFSAEATTTPSESMPGEDEEETTPPPPELMPGEEEEIPPPMPEPMPGEDEAEIPLPPPEPMPGEDEAEIPLPPPEPMPGEDEAEIPLPPPEPTPGEDEEEIPLPPSEPMPDEEEEEMPPPTEPMISLTFDLSVPSGISLIHVPLKVRAIDGMMGAIESVGDLYDALGGAATVNFLITYDPDTQGWHSYFGDSSKGTVADKLLTDTAGIIADMKTAISLRLEGDALGTDGISAITLNRGTNLVGLPLMDSRIVRVSDLFTLEGIRGNVITVIVLDNGTFKTVGRAGDDGDISVTGGQSFILIAREAAMIPISGDGWGR